MMKDNDDASCRRRPHKRGITLGIFGCVLIGISLFAASQTGADYDF